MYCVCRYIRNTYVCIYMAMATGLPVGILLAIPTTENGQCSEDGLLPTEMLHILGPGPTYGPGSIEKNLRLRCSTLNRLWGLAPQSIYIYI